MLPDGQMNPFPARAIGATFSGQGEVSPNLVERAGRRWRRDWARDS
jgi:hypothetical protein